MNTLLWCILYLNNIAVFLVNVKNTSYILNFKKTISFTFVNKTMATKELVINKYPFLGRPEVIPTLSRWNCMFSGTKPDVMSDNNGKSSDYNGQKSLPERGKKWCEIITVVFDKSFLIPSRGKMQRHVFRSFLIWSWHFYYRGFE